MSVLIALGVTVVVSELQNPKVWYSVGAVYVLTLVFASGVWYWRGDSLDFLGTITIAVIVVVGLLPLTPLLFVLDASSFLPTLSQLPLHFQRFVPVAFMFPLGAATARRQRLATVTVMLLPSLYELLDWFVLNPDQFNVFTSPESLIAGTVLWFVSYAAFGGPLFVIGHQLAHENGPLHRVARRRDPSEVG